MKKVIFIQLFIVLCVMGMSAQTWTSGSGLVYLNPITTKVGIGIATPSERVHINGGALKIGNSSSAADRTINLLKFGDGNYVQIGEWEADDVLSFKANQYRFTNGNVGIGITPSSYKLDVNGVTRSDQLLINKPNIVTNWNNLWQSGFYDSCDAANAPESSGWFWGINMGHRSNSNTYKFGGQIAIKNLPSNSEMYFRSTDVDGTGVWRKVLHQGMSELNTSSINLNPNDNFTYNNQSIGHYSLNWRMDSWNSSGPTLWLTAYGGMKFFTAGTPRMFINNNGNVGIGVSPSTKLDVAGTIRAHEVKVCLNQGCDFVFEPDYKLMPLHELETFITTNRHLPEVAPAAVMESEGINLSEMNALLLQKVEELTLYVIELNKEVQILKESK